MLSSAKKDSKEIQVTNIYVSDILAWQGYDSKDQILHNTFYLRP